MDLFLLIATDRRRKIKMRIELQIDENEHLVECIVNEISNILGLPESCVRIYDIIFAT